MESLGAETSWPSKKPREEQSRIHNLHVSLRDRIEELQSWSRGKNPGAVEQGHGGRDTTKAVAWAVFQHHGGGVGHGHRLGMTVRGPTRFKIEAQMKQEVAQRSVYDAAVFGREAGSTLYDSFELNSLLRTLHEASHSLPAGMALQKTHEGEDDGEEAGAMVVYSPKSPTHWTSPRPEPDHDALSERHGHWSLGEAEARRLDTVDETHPSEAHGERHGQRVMRCTLTENVKHGHDDAKDDSSSVFGHWYTPKSIGRRPFVILDDEKPAMDDEKPAMDDEKPAMEASHHHHHHNRWRSLLHTLHLDGANGLFHGLYKSHTQVAPHDLEKTQEHKGRSHHKFNHRDHGSHCDAHLDRELYNGHCDWNDVNQPSEEEDGHHHHRHHPHVWKFGFKTALTQPFCRPGHLLSDDEGSDSEGSHKGHKQYHGHRHTDLRAAWSSLKANLLHHHHHFDHKHQHERGGQRESLQGDEQPEIEHHHHHHHYYHHHHVQPEGEDNEMAVQAISMRVAGTSFDETTRRLSIEEDGLKVPRSSLETPVWA